MSERRRIFRLFRCNGLLERQANHAGQLLTDAPEGVVLNLPEEATMLLLPELRHHQLSLPPDLVVIPLFTQLCTTTNLIIGEIFLGGGGDSDSCLNSFVWQTVQIGKPPDKEEQEKLRLKLLRKNERIAQVNVSWKQLTNVEDPQPSFSLFSNGTLRKQRDFMQNGLLI